MSAEEIANLVSVASDGSLSFDQMREPMTEEMLVKQTTVLAGHTVAVVIRTASAAGNICKIGILGPKVDGKQEIKFCQSLDAQAEQLGWRGNVGSQRHHAAAHH